MNAKLALRDTGVREYFATLTRLDVLLHKARVDATLGIYLTHHASKIAEEVVELAVITGQINLLDSVENVKP
jgi:hypothetical protein